ncbi:MAG: thiamine pyrophosphate-dependent dehydrogenase E1 component subunit alpha [Parasphingorhabdus sp.]
MSSNQNKRLWMYANMVKSRHFEDLIKPAYFEGKSPVFNMAKGPIPGEMHLSDGQEPCAVGVCAHLREDDIVTATHRPHHIAIAKGVDLNGMTAEIFGKKDGLAGGRGGHMHLFDPAVNFSCSGIIAQGLGPAVGAAMAAKLSGSDAVAVAFLGEGAANQGAFHEALNLASVWKAPVVFVIEDNSYGISVSKSDCTAVESNAARAAAYDMPGHHVAGNDPDAISEIAGEAVAYARSGQGPSLIEIETSRLEGHFMGDPEGYRPDGEVERLKELDPIPKYRARLLADGFEEADLESAEQDARNQVDQAFSFARENQYPEPEEVYDHVFV